MYYPYFIAYMIVGFFISLVVLLWALRNGQFSDQQRARFLPLEDEAGLNDGNVSRASRIQFVALGCLVFAGLAATAVVLVLALTSGR